jgi:hypothetical protein
MQRYCYTQDEDGQRRFAYGLGRVIAGNPQTESTKREAPGRDRQRKIELRSSPVEDEEDEEEICVYIS